MKPYKSQRLAALICCLALLFTACANPLDLLEGTGALDGPRITTEGGGSGQGGSRDSGGPQPEGSLGGGARSRYGASRDGRNLVDYSQMEYSRPDVEAMKQGLADIAAAMAGAEDFFELAELDYESGTLWMEFNTMYVLAMLGTYQDYASEFWQEEYDYLIDASVELETLNNELNRAIVEGPFAEEYREWYGEYVFEYLESSLQLSDPAAEAYKQERERLGAQYSSDVAELTVEWQGETLTMDDIYQMPDYDSRIGAYMAYYQQNAEHFTEMYVRMVELDKLTAEVLGFDSAADMYYLTYSRDYTPAQAQRLCDLVKELFADVVPYALSATYPQEADYDTLMAAMPQILEQVDTQLVDAWDSMLDYHLYDHEARENKQSGVGFTTYISAYDAPFTYSYWEGDNRSATTVIHEFGHYYDNWLHYDTSSIGNLDIAEIYSQSLEVLTQRFYGELFEYPEAAMLYHMGDLLQSVTYQALLEEFQLIVYELDSLDATSIAAVYTGLMEDYGYGEYLLVDENGLDHSWFEITHLFLYPFYTISYTTSAVVALQIWAESQTDWEAAADTYLDMVHEDQLQPFLTLVEAAGLENPLGREALAEIATVYRDWFEVPEAGGRAA